MSIVFFSLQSSWLVQNSVPGGLSLLLQEEEGWRVPGWRQRTGRVRRPAPQSAEQGDHAPTSQLGQAWVRKDFVQPEKSL